VLSRAQVIKDKVSCFTFSSHFGSGKADPVISDAMSNEVTCGHLECVGGIVSGQQRRHLLVSSAPEPSGTPVRKRFVSGLPAVPAHLLVGFSYQTTSR
jgi:hypothetical protein